MSDSIIIAVLVLLSIVSIFAAVVVICKFGFGRAKKFNTLGALMIVLAVGLVIRLLLGMFITGNRADYGMIQKAIEHIGNASIPSYYAGDAAKSVFPFGYFVYVIFGGFAQISGLVKYDAMLRFIIKLPLIIADLVTAVFIYKIANRYFDRVAGLVGAALVAVCPVFYIGSAVWTSQIAFTCMFAVIAFYFMARKNYIGTVLATTGAAYSSKEGVYILAAVAVFCGFHMISACVKIKKDGASAKAVLGENYRAAVFIPVGLVGGFLCAYLLTMIGAGSYSVNPFRYIYEYLLEPLCSISYFTYDGLSVYALFARNGAAPDARFPARLFAVIFSLIVTAVVCVVYFTKRNRATLVMLAAFSALTMTVYYPDGGAAGGMLALVALLSSYMLVKDKRILYVLAVIGLCFVLNAAGALANMQQLNTLGDYYFTVSGVPVIGNKVLNIVCSALAVVAHLYFTVITVIIGMTGQKKELAPADGFCASMRMFFQNDKRG